RPERLSSFTRSTPPKASRAWRRASPGAAPAAISFSVSRSRWKRTSSSSSRSTSWDRRIARSRYRSSLQRSLSIGPPSAHVEDEGHGGGEATPRLSLLLEAAASRPGEAVELGATIVLGGAPFRLDPAPALE